MTTTPNMSLNIVDQSTNEYDWAAKINSNLILVDSHDHSPGKGVQVSSSYINFLSDAKVNGNITNAGFTQFVNTTVRGFSSSIADSFAVSGGDLYFVDNSRRVVQLTSGDSIYYPSGTGNTGFGGDYVVSGAEVIYTSGNQTYTFTTDGTTLASVYSNTISPSTYNTGSNFLTFTSSASIQTDISNIDFNIPTGSNPYAAQIQKLSSTSFKWTNVDVLCLRVTDSSFPYQDYFLQYDNINVASLVSDNMVLYFDYNLFYTYILEPNGSDPDVDVYSSFYKGLGFVNNQTRSAPLTFSATSLANEQIGGSISPQKYTSACVRDAFISHPCGPIGVPIYTVDFAYSTPISNVLNSVQVSDSTGLSCNRTISNVTLSGNGLFNSSNQEDNVIVLIEKSYVVSGAVIP